MSEEHNLRKALARWVCMVWVAVAGPALSQSVMDESLVIEPSAPTDLDEITVRVSFTTSNAAALASVEVALEERRISLDVELLPCLILCPPDLRQFDAVVGPLEAGTYTVEAAIGQEAFLETELTVFPASPYTPTMSLLPGVPSENDFVELALALLVDDCSQPLPEVRSVGIDAMHIAPDSEEVDGLVDVVLEAAIPGVPCEGALRPAAVPVALGQLMPGHYSVTLVLRTIALPGPPGAGSFDAQLPENVEEAVIGRYEFSVAAADPTVRLQDRFVVSMRWREPNGTWRDGRPVPRKLAAPELEVEPEAGLFAFFDRGNWEVLVKVLDGCAINGHFWVFVAAATDLEFEISIDDESSAERWSFVSSGGVAAPAVNDVTALASCEL